jgi:hypothetical protein
MIDILPPIEKIFYYECSNRTGFNKLEQLKIVAKTLIEKYKE